jgi:hypothetical protein
VRAALLPLLERDRIGRRQVLREHRAHLVAEFIAQHHGVELVVVQEPAPPRLVEPIVAHTTSTSAVLAWSITPRRS